MSSASISRPAAVQKRAARSSKQVPDEKRTASVSALKAIIMSGKKRREAETAEAPIAPEVVARSELPPAKKPSKTKAGQKASLQSKKQERLQPSAQKRPSSKRPKLEKKSGQ